MLSALLAVICALACLVAVSAIAAPVNSTAPTVGGQAARLGAQVVCESGSWQGSVSKFTFSWFRSGVEIAGEQKMETPNYALTKADEGHEVWCVATAKGEGSEVSAESSNSVEFGPVEPPPEPVVNKTPPEVRGKGELSAQLECSQGAWSGRPAPTYSYEWLRDGTQIRLQTNSTYTVGVADEGHTLSCEVIAKNSVNEAFKTSSNSVSVKGRPPQNAQPPAVEGIPAVGETLTCNHGEWTGTPEITYSYEWLLGGSKVSGAIGSTLFVEAPYEGRELACRVTAKNSIPPEGHAASRAVTIHIAKPENTSLPVISGSDSQGSKLSCSRGSWTGSPTNYEYRWYRQLGPGEELQLGPEVDEYEVQGEDVGHTLHCTVTARNGGGNGIPAQSAGFVIPEGGGEAPQDTSLPLVSGNAQPHDGLTCTEGHWSGTAPIAYEYQWVRDAGSSHKVDISGAVHPAYTVQNADEGHSLSCQVTATNKYGSAHVSSEPLGVPGKAPVDTEAPSVSGTPRLDETMTCLRGEWEGAPPLEYGYQWQREGKAVGSGYVYKVQAADLGHPLRCVVTATNGVGSMEAIAEVYVPGGAPEPLEAPTITGEPSVNKELTCGEGRWKGEPLTPSYEWLVNGVAIPGQTHSTYTVTTADRGLLLVCRVTETNVQGSVAADSAAVRVAGLVPKDVVAPTIAGSGSLGARLTCEHGLWEGAPPPAFSYRWYREGVPIAGAAEATYTVEPADQGHLLVCFVAAANVQGRAEAESTNAVAVSVRKAEGEHSSTLVAGAGGPRASATAVHNAFLSQLPGALASARLKSVRKSGLLLIGFTAPGAGRFEVRWYLELKAPHHHFRQVLIARGTISYARASRTTMRLTLTPEGRRHLKNARRIRLYAEARFAISGGSLVSWGEAFTLH